MPTGLESENMKMSWIDQFSNAQAVWGVFPNGDVPLTNLLLLDFKYASGNKLTVALVSTVLPPQLPDRWLGRGVQAIELRFEFGTVELEVNVPKELGESPMLSASFSEGIFELRAQESLDCFSLKARVFSARLLVQPVDLQSL
jgi:hypothetical protein